MKEPWKKLQEKVGYLLTLHGVSARETAGSGSVKGNGDVISRRFLFECKLRSRKNIVIEQEHWLKIKEEAELLEKIPAIVSENESGEILVTLSLSDFVNNIHPGG